MESYNLSETLKYLDFFGTNINFYTDKHRKFYTSFGGIFTLLSIFFGIAVFIQFNYDDLFHNIPISTTSIKKESYRNIKFIEEKIWIPWRIRDYQSKTFNHKGLLYPIIYYYKGVKNTTEDSLDLSYDIINYTLCNETSMINNYDSYIIDKELDQLYCIDMDELNMGGNWDYNFLNYVKFDLYLCKNGIDYDENNLNCSSYDKIIEASDKYNSLAFEMYYPVVHYQPMNKTTPIFIRYSEYFYHLSRFSNKIDRIYLQQYILKDDKGWFFKNEKFFSNWGYVTLNGDSYTTGNKKDLINEGSSSRLYSFNIYLKSDVVYYSRSYKKLFFILADGLPIVNVIFTLFKLISKVLKISSENKKLTELLFENSIEKKQIISNNSLNLSNLKPFKINSDPKNNKMKRSHKNYNNFKLDKSITQNNNITTNNINDFSFIQLSPVNQKKPSKFKNIENRRRSVVNKSRRSKFFKHSITQFNHNKKLFGRQHSISLNNLNANLESPKIYNNNNNNNINININNNIGDYSNYKKRIEDKEIKDKENENIETKSKSYIIQKKLFSYKYYICSIFIKNIHLNKNSNFFPEKFIFAYNFICQLLDISSYIMLQREFQIMKNTIMMGKYKDIFDNKQKINVNDSCFNNDIMESLDEQNFNILGRLRNIKDI